MDQKRTGQVASQQDGNVAERQTAEELKKLRASGRTSFWIMFAIAITSLLTSLAICWKVYQR